MTKTDWAITIIGGIVTTIIIIVMAFLLGNKFDEWYENRYCYYIGAGVVETNGETTAFEDDFGNIWEVEAEPQFTEGKEVILFMDTKCDNEVANDEVIDIVMCP